MTADNRSVGNGSRRSGSSEYEHELSSFDLDILSRQDLEIHAPRPYLTRWDHLKGAASIVLYAFSSSNRETSFGTTGRFRRAVSVDGDENRGFHPQRLGAAPGSNQGHAEGRLGHKPTILNFSSLLREIYSFIWGSQLASKKVEVLKIRYQCVRKVTYIIPMLLGGEIPKLLQPDTGDVLVIGLFSSGNKVPKERILKLRPKSAEWLNWQIWLNVIRLCGLRYFFSLKDVRGFGIFEVGYFLAVECLQLF
jgi:hypothetical protein